MPPTIGAFRCQGKGKNNIENANVRVAVVTLGYCAYPRQLRALPRDMSGYTYVAPFCGLLRTGRMSNATVPQA